MEFSLEAMDTESLREQLQSIEQEYSTSYGARVKLDLNNPHEQLKETIQELNQTQRTCACIAGIALFLMDKQDELMDKQIQNETETQIQQNELSDLREHIKMQEFKLAKKSEKKKQILFEKQSLQQTNEDIKRQLNENQQQLTQLRDKYNNLKLQNKNFQTQTTESSEFQKSIKAKVQQYKQQVKQYEEVIKQNETNIKELQIMLVQEKKKNEEIEYEVTNLQQELTIAKHKHEKQKEDLSNIKDQYEIAKNELKSKNNLIHELQKEKEMYESHFESPRVKVAIQKNSYNQEHEIKTPSKVDLQKELLTLNELPYQEDEFHYPINGKQSIFEVDQQSSLEETEKHFKGISSAKQRAVISFTPEVSTQQVQPMFLVSNKELKKQKLEYLCLIPQKSSQRDPIEQHFQLLTQSAKINSPYMDQICTVSNANLYAKCVKQGVPIHKVKNNAVALMDRKRTQH